MSYNEEGLVGKQIYLLVLFFPLNLLEQAYVSSLHFIFSMAGCWSWDIS